MAEFDDRTDMTLLPPVTLPSRSELSLMVLEGPEAGRHYRIPPEGATIGRHIDADIRINDPAVSRRHAQITRTDDGRYVIRDLGSRFGVYVEGRRITVRELGDRDRIHLSGETVLRVSFQDPREAELMERLQDAAISDPLTGLANARYLKERLEQEVAYAHRHQVPLTILMIDVDHFKEVNDQFGHHTGDQVLRAIAGILKATIRTEDVAARNGGDEFVIISRGHASEGGLRFAERLCELVRNKDLRIDGQQLWPTLSIGVASFLPDDERDVAQDLLQRADAALYRAKRGGRDRAATWVPPEATEDIDDESVEPRVTVEMERPKELETILTRAR